MTQSESISLAEPSAATPGFIGRISIRIGGSKAKEVERFLKFAVVGLSGTFVNSILLFIVGALLNAQPGSLALGIAEAIAYGIAIFNNFVWNRFWVYPDSRSKPMLHQLAMFYVINAIGFVISTILVVIASGPLTSLLANVLHHVTATQTDARLGTQMSLYFVATPLVMFWNFFVNRYITYNDVK